MNTLRTAITNWFVVRFWASPLNSMDDVFLANDLCIERMMQKLKSYDPGFPRDDPPPEPPAKPARPFPTDVPAPEPYDVPVPEPIDVPPPDPGEVPKPAKQPERPKQGPKPRPIP
jgi:hypothetical protein